MTQKIQPQGIDNTTGMLTTFDVGMATSMCMCNCVINTTSVGNVGAGVDDLITFTLPSAQLSDNGDYIKITAWGTLAANANSKQMKLVFGGTTLYDSAAQLQIGGSWIFEAIVIRTGAATQKAVTKASFTGGIFFIDDLLITNPTETLGGVITIKCTGEGVANDDIVQEGLIVTYFSAT